VLGSSLVCLRWWMSSRHRPSLFITIVITLLFISAVAAFLHMCSVALQWRRLVSLCLMLSSDRKCFG
jgi:apolipoprotein N-acyltransferase